MKLDQSTIDLLSTFAPEVSKDEIELLGLISRESQNKLAPLIARLCAGANYLTIKGCKRLDVTNARVFAMTAIIHALTRTLIGMLSKMQQDNMPAAVLVRKGVLDLIEKER